METWDIVLRFAITFFLALIFGIERQKAHKPIGFGTFIFVSIGSCGLAITALSLSIDNPYENPIPLLSAIVTGIGFLGAGALIKTTDRIFGFTTAASVWFFAIFGLIIGVGQYLTGLLMYSLAWVVIIYDGYLEKKGVGLYQKKVTVCANRVIHESDIQKLIGAVKCKLINIHVDKKDDRLHVTYLVEGLKEEIEEIPKRLHSQDWFDHCKIE
jgi:putative Mg2+ transporter-C (MgtC) family protein